MFAQSTVLSFLVISLAGCGTTSMTGRVRGLPGDLRHPCTADVAGVVSCDAQRYATVLCLPKIANSCRALGLTYADDGETVWLYRANGFDVSAPEKYRKPSYVDVQFASDIVLSSDGEWIWFRTRSLPGTNTWHAYSVSRGVMYDVDRSDVWKIWALLREGRALWFGRERPAWEFIRW